MFWQVFHFHLFQVFLDMVLGVLLVLCMDGRHLYTTNMVWSGHFCVGGMGTILLPSFASLSASLFPMMFVWALTLYR